MCSYNFYLLIDNARKLLVILCEIALYFRFFEVFLVAAFPTAVALALFLHHLPSEKKMASASPVPSSSGCSPIRSPHRIFKKLEYQKLSKQTKQVVCNVYAQVRLTQPGLSVASVFRSVSQLTGVSERTVARLKADVLKGTLKSPKRERLRFAAKSPAKVTGKTRVQRYDSFTLSALRRKVHQYYIRNEVPTAEKILSEVIGDTDMGLPKQLSVRTMRRLLNDIGFAFRKRKRNCALLERDDIIVWRRKYLRTIREMRKEKRYVQLLLRFVAQRYKCQRCQLKHKCRM